jgi:general secretion pathway protein H
MIKAFHHRPGARHPAGFTLLEMIIVVAVLGLSLGLIVTRGPMRSPTVEMQAAVNQVAQGLRVARSRAIATNAPVRFTVDVAAHSVRIDNERPAALPRAVSIDMVAVAEETQGSRLAAIRFNPDGSATGGQINLADGQRAAHIGVDWLTGRVNVARVH